MIKFIGGLQWLFQFNLLIWPPKISLLLYIINNLKKYNLINSLQLARIKSEKIV